MSSLRIESCSALDHPGWLGLRAALWPHASRDQHLAEMACFVAAPQRFAQFVARIEDDAVGLCEVSLRNDYVLGTDGPPPIGFLEGLYVVPLQRRRGIARLLVDGAMQWARERGCSEFASDALLDNSASHAMHRALGFDETERVVCFVKKIRPR